jgi:hypothetical protein
MTRNVHKPILRKLLFGIKGNVRLWLGLTAICLGTVLLLFCILIWTGFTDVLAGKYDKDAIGREYLTLSKKISDEKIAEQKLQVFTTNEINTISSYPGVEDIGIFSSGKFPIIVTFAGGDSLSFSSNIFIESVPDRFIDDKPIDWYWQYDSPAVPVIVSTEFLNLYNFGFAPNEGVPQLTKGTIRSLSFTLRVGDSVRYEIFNAHVVGFSNRISSILVPQSFIEFGNKLFSGDKNFSPSRLLILVKDPSDEGLRKFIAEREYETNNELLRWNKLRAIIHTVSIALGVVAVSLLVMGLLVFLLFIQLTVTHSRNNIQALVQIGYNPRFLNRYIFTRYLLLLLCCMIIAGVVTVILQVRVAKYLIRLDLLINTFPSWQVWVVWSVVTVAAVVWVNRVIARTVVKF